MGIIEGFCVMAMFDDEIIEMVAKGVPHRQIARELGQTIGQVSGRITRMRKAGKMAASALSAAKSSANRKEPLGCRYITGNPGRGGSGVWHYCQNPTESGAVWCDEHLLVVFRPHQGGSKPCSMQHYDLPAAWSPR